MKKKIRLIHIGVHESLNKNSGDTLLFPVVRKVFDDNFKTKIFWKKIQAWEDFNSQLINQINLKFDGIIIGGGGLFLSDQKGSNTKNSGWQWNCSLNNLKKIKVPIVLFAVGYNKFRGQKEFKKKFDKHVTTLLEKSIFFGLRNSGSISSIKKHIQKKKLIQKIKFQPCPTICLENIYKFNHSNKKDVKKICINVSLDRRHLRFKSYNFFIEQMNNYFKFLINEGWKIIYVAHKDLDLNFLEKINKEIYSKMKVKDLTNLEPKHIMNFYRSSNIVVGMRGHAQMIPFGLDQNIISLISHNKMKYFLKDNKIMQQGIEVNDKNLSKKLIKLTKETFQNYKKLNTKIKKMRSIQWNLTKTNLSKISDIILSNAIKRQN